MIRCFGLGFVAGSMGFFPSICLSETTMRFFNGPNVKMRSDPSLFDVSFDVKVQCVLLGIIKSPIEEEILFRGIIQDVFFHRVPKAISQRICPSINWVFRTPFACGARIIATSALFACAHQNKEAPMHLFFLGLGLGMIKESPLKLAGSIGAHMANNCISLSSVLRS